MKIGTGFGFLRTSGNACAVAPGQSAPRLDSCGSIAKVLGSTRFQRNRAAALPRRDLATARTEKRWSPVLTPRKVTGDSHFLQSPLSSWHWNLMPHAGLKAKVAVAEVDTFLGCLVMRGAGGRGVRGRWTRWRAPWRPLAPVPLTPSPGRGLVAA